MSPPLSIGIDVATAQVDGACRPPDARWTVPHTAGGMTRLIRRLSRLRPSLVVLEATGGLELSLASELAAAAMPAAVINPRQARHFANATGQLAKTDALDAGTSLFFASQTSRACTDMVLRRTVRLIIILHSSRRESRAPQRRRAADAGGKPEVVLHLKRPNASSGPFRSAQGASRTYSSLFMAADKAHLGHCRLTGTLGAHGTRPPHHLVGVRKPDARYSSRRGPRTRAQT